MEPTFSQAPLYKHHFECVNEQIKKLAALAVSQRFQRVRTRIKNAMQLHEELSEAFFDLDVHGNREHLQPWLEGLNQFYRKYFKN